MEDRINRALDFMGFYSSFEEVQQTFGLDEKEVVVLKQKAQQRYGKEVFCNQ